VDDDHVLVAVSATDRQLAGYGKFEYSSTLNINIANRTGAILFANDPRFIAVGYGVLSSYVIGDKPYAFAWSIPREGAETGSKLQNRSNAEFTRWWPDLWRIDLTSNAVERAAAGSQDIDNWAVGPDGTVAGYSNFYNNTETWELFRGAKPLFQRKTPRREVGLDGLGRSAGSLLVIDQSGDADQWVEIDAAGASQTLWAGKNVTGVLRSPKTGLALGAVIDGARYELFDAALQTKIDAATRPFHGDIKVMSATDDFT
jgi:hypothetical protein